jgi:hypothetical protein
VAGGSALYSAAPESLTDSITKVVRQFFTALVDRDRPAMAKVIVPQEQWEAMLGGPHPLSGKDAAAAKVAIDQLTCRLLQPGDTFTLKNGRKAGITPLMVNESNQVAAVTIAGETLPVPFRMVRTTNSEWRLDPQPFISASIRAQRAAEKTQPKP